MPSTQTLLFAILLGVSAVLVVLSEPIHNAILDSIFAILAVFIALLAFSTKYYTYLFIPTINAAKERKKNIVVSSNEAFTLSPAGDVVITKEGSEVYASAFVIIPVYKSATEMSPEAKIDFARLFSRIMTLSKTPAKVSSQLYIVNKDEYIAKIRKKLEEAEDNYRNLSATTSQPSMLDRAKGEIMMWRNMLYGISGSHSQSLVTYAMVSAEAGTEEEATNIARERAGDLSAGISTLLGVTAHLARSDEILRLVEPEYMIPTETINERIRQKAREAEI